MAWRKRVSLRPSTFEPIDWELECGLDWVEAPAHVDGDRRRAVVYPADDHVRPGWEMSGWLLMDDGAGRELESMRPREQIMWLSAALICARHDLRRMRRAAGEPERARPRVVADRAGRRVRV